MKTNIQPNDLTYSVPPEKDIFHFSSQKRKITRGAIKTLWNAFSLVVFPIGAARILSLYLNRWLTPRVIVPSLKRFSREKLLRLRRHFIQGDPTHRKEVSIQTADGVCLEGLELLHPSQMALPTEKQKWVIYYNGNRGASENGVEVKLIKRISEHAKVNIFSCNYRGVGNPSQPPPRKSKDLIVDGEAILQYILSKGVLQENILLHGWSLGGAVAAAVAVHHQEEGHEVHLCSDRSFSTFSREVASFVPYIGPIAAAFAYTTGWRFNSLKNFQKIKGHKFTIHHPQDSIVCYHKASLHRALKISKMTRTDRQLKRIRELLDKHYNLSIDEVLKKGWSPRSIPATPWKRLVLSLTVRQYKRKLKKAGYDIETHRLHYQPKAAIESQDMVYTHHISDDEVHNHLKERGVHQVDPHKFEKTREDLVGRIAHRKFLNDEDFDLYLEQIRIALGEV